MFLISEPNRSLLVYRERLNRIRYVRDNGRTDETDVVPGNFSRMGFQLPSIPVANDRYWH